MSRGAIAVGLIGFGAAACVTGATPGPSPAGTLASTSDVAPARGTTPPERTASAPVGPIAFCHGCALQAGCSSFADDDIVEASGIAASSAHPGAFYIHNDSGDKARFYATNCAGDDLGTYRFKGETAVDWEDMARGPCGDKTCLFFGDIGDNDSVRPEIALVRTPEPSSLSQGKHEVVAERMTLRYPDGAHDSETLLIHPKTGEIAIVTKVYSGKSGVYVTPSFSPGGSATLTKAGSVEPLTGSVRFTSGDVHPRGEGVLLRTYTSLFFYAMRPEQTIAQALSGAPCEMPVMLELQGESVSFTSDGDGYVTVSEQRGQSLHFSACK